jgi:hypothetical protein
MRPKVGANLPQDEAKRVESQFGSPMQILKSPETTEKLINRQIKRQGGIIDQGLRQWGATTGTPMRTQDGAPAIGPGGSQIEYQDRYIGGNIKDMFGMEFEGLNMGRVMETTAIDSLSEMEALRNQLAETPESATAERANIEEQIVRSAVSLLDTAKKNGLNDEQNAELFKGIETATAGIDPRAFASERLRSGQEFWPSMETPGEAFKNVSSDEKSGKMFAETLQEERDRYGGLGAMGRAEQGIGPLSKEEFDMAAKWIERNN